MPEPSARDRERAAQLRPDVATTLLIDCVELGHDVRFQCQYCGMERTWGRREMLSARLRKHLAWPLDRVQAATVCPVRGCGGPMPLLRLMAGGYQDGPKQDASERRAWLIEALLDAGVMPADVGLVTTPVR